MFVAPVFVAVTTAILVPVLSRASDDGTSDPPGPSTSGAPGGLEVVDVAVVPGRQPKLLTDPPGDPPVVDVTVRNVGDRVSVITGADFEILDFGLLRICQAGGGLDPTAAYDVELPADPGVDDVVQSKVSQEIRPNHADRFAFSLSVPPSRISEGMRLYHLSVVLLHDGGERLDGGTAVLSVPYAPDPRYFPPGNPGAERFPADVRDCYVQNESLLERFLAIDAERSPDLDASLLEPVGG